MIISSEIAEIANQKEIASFSRSQIRLKPRNWAKFVATMILPDF